MHEDLILAVTNAALLEKQPIGINYFVQSAQKCCEYCKNEPNCAAFSWTGYDVGYCIGFVDPLNFSVSVGDFYSPVVSGNLRGARPLFRVLC